MAEAACPGKERKSFTSPYPVSRMSDEKTSCPRSFNSLSFVQGSCNRQRGPSPSDARKTGRWERRSAPGKAACRRCTLAVSSGYPPSFARQEPGDYQSTKHQLRITAGRVPHVERTGVTDSHDDAIANEDEQDGQSHETGYGRQFVHVHDVVPLMSCEAVDGVRLTDGPAFARTREVDGLAIAPADCLNNPHLLFGVVINGCAGIFHH